MILFINNINMPKYLNFNFFIKLTQSNKSMEKYFKNKFKNII